MQKAEQFLKTARLGVGFAGGAFDFISVCPPYLLVDYNELYDLLEASPLVRLRPDVGQCPGAVHCFGSGAPMEAGCSGCCSDGTSSFGPLSA